MNDRYPKTVLSEESPEAGHHLAALLHAQNRALEMLLEKAPLHDVLTHLARAVEIEGEGQAVASIMLLDGENALRKGGAPSLPDHYQDAIDGIKISPTLGTCCAAAATGEIVITCDFETDSGWEGIRHLPLALGLVAAWSMPIKARDGRVLGTFGTYFREKRGPSPREIAVVEVLSRTAAVAIEHDARESARLELEADFLSLADNIAQLAWMADQDGFRFWFNKRWYEYTGSDFEQVKGRGWESLHHPDYRERAIAGMQASFSRQAVWEDTFPLKGRDGTYRWFLTRAVPVYDKAGGFLYWLGTNTDVTDARLAQEALKEADLRKDQFLAILSHELRNPLSPLVNALKILAIKAGDRQTVMDLQEMMERQVSHMVRLVDDLMEVSRITRGKIEIKKDLIDLRSSIQFAIETVRPAIDKARHRLTVDWPPYDVPVEADSMRMTQVFSNLLNNAARYTPVGGDIRIAVSTTGSDVQVSVRDSGKGIDPSRLLSIFELFDQGDLKGTASAAGLGIGLTLARELVDLHGGRIEARSGGAGKGAEFVVTLPLSLTDKKPSLLLESGQVAAPYRVLVVDDNRDAADSLALLLRHTGIASDATHDGQSALEAIERLRPDIVILDLGMEKIDGFEVAQRIRRNPAYDGMSLIALSGWNQQEIRNRTRTSGFDMHMSKPVDLNNLLSAMRLLRETAD